MTIRRLLAICSLVAIAGILVACGSENDTPAPTATVADSTTPVETESPIVDSPTGTPAATPIASPVQPEATPERGLYTGTQEDLMKTPQVQPTGPTTEVAEIPTAVPLVAIAGTLTLDGRVQQDYTVTEDGCVGLGEWRQLKPGTQVIVRNASGTVVDVGTLEAVDSEDGCTWSFAVQIPAEDYFSLSIPMVTEVWFDQSDPAVQTGNIELFVP